MTVGVPKVIGVAAARATDESATEMPPMTIAPTPSEMRRLLVAAAPFMSSRYRMSDGCTAAAATHTLDGDRGRHASRQQQRRPRRFRRDDLEAARAGADKRRPICLICRYQVVAVGTLGLWRGNAVGVPCVVVCVCEMSAPRHR